MSFFDIKKLANEVTNYLNNSFLGYFHCLPTYILLFILLVLEGIPFLGMFIPGETIIIVSVILSIYGFMNIWFILLVVSLASIFGDFIAFEYGKKYGKDYILKHGSKFFITHKRYKQLEILTKTNLGKTVFIGRFHSLTRCFVPFIAGSLNIDEKRFLFWNIITGISWSIIFVFAGFLFGEGFTIIIKFLGEGIIILTAIVLLFYYILYIFKKKKFLLEYSVEYILLFLLTSYSFIIILLSAIKHKKMTNLSIWVINKVNTLPILVKGLFLIFYLITNKIFLILFTIYLIYYFYKKKEKNYFYLTLFSSIILLPLTYILNKSFEIFNKELYSNLVLSNKVLSLNVILISMLFLIIYIYIYDKFKKDEVKMFFYLFFLTLISFFLTLSYIVLKIHFTFSVLASFFLSSSVVFLLFFIFSNEKNLENFIKMLLKNEKK